MYDLCLWTGQLAVQETQHLAQCMVDVRKLVRRILIEGNDLLQTLPDRGGRADMGEDTTRRTPGWGFGASDWHVCCYLRGSVLLCIAPPRDTSYCSMFLGIRCQKEPFTQYWFFVSAVLC